jgi:hypothetical protein
MMYGDIRKAVDAAIFTKTNTSSGATKYWAFTSKQQQLTIDLQIYN